MESALRRPIPYEAPPRQPVSTSVRMLSLLLALYVAGVYMGLAGVRYTQSAYVGAMYAVAAMGLLVCGAMAAAGAQLHRLEWPAWFLAALTCAGTFVGFFVARTVGLPSYHPSGWPPWMLIAMAADLGYLLLYAVALRQAFRDRSAPVRQAA